MLCAWAMPVPFFFPVRRQKTVISLSKGRGQCELVLAAHPASELCEQQQRTDFCLPHRMIPKSGVRFSDQIMRNKGRSAERRIQPWPCHKRGTAARQADGPAQVVCAPFACFAGARSPSGAPPRHFADCSAHLRAALPGITGCEREDPPRRQCSEHLAGRS
jgi:hypothetical protein